MDLGSPGSLSLASDGGGGGGGGVDLRAARAAVVVPVQVALPVADDVYHGGGVVRKRGQRRWTRLDACVISKCVIFTALLFWITLTVWQVRSVGRGGAVHPGKWDFDRQPASQADENPSLPGTAAERINAEDA